MRPNHLFTILSAAAITGSAFFTPPAQACFLGSDISSSTNPVSQSPQLFKPTKAGKSAAGIALLGSLLAVGGVYWSRRRQSDSVTNEVNAESEPSTPVIEQVSEQELVSSRK